MKIGRNDPCPCGSGEKYKKCCEAKDLAARAEQLAAEQAALVDTFDADDAERAKRQGAARQQRLGSHSTYAPDGKRPSHARKRTV